MSIKYRQKKNQMRYMQKNKNKNKQMRYMHK